MGGNLGSFVTLLLWLVIFIILIVLFVLSSWKDPVVKIPEYLFFAILFAWGGVGVIIYGLNEISLQLDRYDNLKLTQLEKIREELADIRQRLESIDETLRTCFKKQGMIPRCCGFVNPQRATSQGRGWGS